MKQSKIRSVLQSIALLVLAGTAAAEPKLEDHSWQVRADPGPASGW